MKTTKIRKGAVSRIPTQNGGKFSLPNSSVGTAELEDLGATRSKLAVGAIGVMNTVSKSSAYTATTSDDIIFVSSSSSWILGLYTAIGNAGRAITIIRTDSSPSNLVTIQGFGGGFQTINSLSSYVMNLQFQRITLVSNGANWFIREEVVPKVSGTASSTSVSQASTSYTLLTGASMTLIGTGRAVNINFAMTGENQASTVTHSYRIYVDGSPVGPEGKFTAYNGAAAGFYYAVPLTHQFTPTLGSHSYEIRFFTSTGAFGLVNGQFSFNVTEVRD